MQTALSTWGCKGTACELPRKHIAERARTSQQQNDEMSDVLSPDLPSISTALVMNPPLRSSSPRPLNLTLFTAKRSAIVLIRNYRNANAKRCDGERSEIQRDRDVSAGGIELSLSRGFGRAWDGLSVIRLSV